jgi:hypothetical protein
MADLNLTAAWTGILAGMVAGAGLGLFFHREEWLGGYGSWRRRLLRLGHISLFGLAFVNLAFALTADRMGWRAGAPSPAGAASALLVAGAILMPLVCALAAWRRPLRHLFFLPVGTLIAAAALVAGTLATAPGKGAGP